MKRLKGQNMVDVKKINRRKIIEILYRYGPISRATISEITSLTPPTISASISEMIKEGIVLQLDECEREKRKRAGRKRILVDLVADSRYSVGVELGVDKIRVCLTDIKCKVRDMREFTVSSREPRLVVGATCEVIEDLIKTNMIDRDKVVGVGVGATGFVESHRGIVRNSPNVGWKNVNLKELFECLLGLKVIVENNIRMMAWGENFIDIEHKSENMIFIHVGKGLGCAIIINGKLFKGSFEGAGEIGHTTIETNGKECSCGKCGCLETLATERAVLEEVGQTLGKENNFKHLTILEVLEASREGNEHIREILSRAGGYIGIGTANLINILNPETVILHGNMLRDAVVREAVLDSINKNVFSKVEGEVKIRFSNFGEELGAIGASAMAIREFFIMGEDY